MKTQISPIVVLSTGLQPLEQQSAPLRRRIIASLRDAIEIGHLAPGARLIEKELCEQLNVSRTSLREALRELHAVGILEYTSNRSLAVTGISGDDAENVYRIRAVVESLITEQFIERANDQMLRLLLQDAEILKDAYRSGNLQSMLTAKRAFYDRLSAGAENPIALDIIGRLTLLTSSLRARSLLRSERQKQSIKEISRLVTAIKRRDVVAARRAAMEHVQHSASSALRTV
jgi:DNA-binding GntR family transcriptional regulator